MTTINETFGTITIDVHSRITSEVQYEIGFRHIGVGAATVETGDLSNPKFDNNFDAIFGDRPNPSNARDPLETTRLLQVGHLEPLTSLTTTIFHDLRPEEDECYVINIFTINTETSGGRVNYECNANKNNPDDFFCDHTVCILDNDG